ncbi:P-type ATPase, A domain [Phytophthora cactorum]|nr:P-type ATPase, A domain [Phytophthora cactorum]
MDIINLILVVDGIVAIALGMAVGGNPSTNWMEGTCVLITVLAISRVTVVGDFQKERQFRALNAVNENELVRVVRYGNHSKNKRDRECASGRLWWGYRAAEPGDEVPADGLAFNTRELNVDESTLIGESELMRNGDALLMQGSESSGEEVLPVKLYSGTRVMEGFAKMLVLCVGEHSQYGQITALINGSAQGEEQIDDDEKKSKQSSGSIQDGSSLNQKRRRRSRR